MTNGISLKDELTNFIKYNEEKVLVSDVVDGILEIVEKRFSEYLEQRITKITIMNLTKTPVDTVTVRDQKDSKNVYVYLYESGKVEYPLEQDKNAILSYGVNYGDTLQVNIIIETVDEHGNVIKYD